MKQHQAGRGPGKLVPVAALSLVLAATMTAISTAAATSHATAGAKLTLAKAKADVAAARKPMTTFTGPKVSPGPVPKGKSVASIYSVPAPLPQRSAGGVVDAAKHIGWKGKVVFGN